MSAAAVEISPRPVSARRLAANRANAKKSTGPRTAAGKARVGRNAVRHGLTAKQGCDPAVGRAIDQIGQLLAPGADGEEAELAYEIAAMEVQINRARVARLRLYREPEACCTDRVVADPERTEQRLREMLRELEAIKRHERKAWRQRQRTIKALVNMRLGIAPRPKRVPGVPRVGFRTPSFEVIKIEGLPRWLWWRPEPPEKQKWRRAAEAERPAPARNAARPGEAGSAASGAQATAVTEVTTTAPARPTSPDIRPRPEAERASPCKSSNQSQSPDGRADRAAWSQPATPPALQIVKTKPFGPELEAEPAPPCKSSNQSQPMPGAPEPAVPALQNEKTKPVGRRPKLTTRARPAPRVEENPARIPTDGPTEPPPPPPGTPEWDEYYRRSMGQPIGRHTEWWPNGPARTDREIEEERLRSVGGYSDIEIRMHRALNRKPSWTRDHSDLEARIHRALNRKPSWIRGPPRR